MSAPRGGWDEPARYGSCPGCGARESVAPGRDCCNRCEPASPHLSEIAPEWTGTHPARWDY